MEPLTKESFDKFLKEWFTSASKPRKRQLHIGGKGLKEFYKHLGHEEFMRRFDDKNGKFTILTNHEGAEFIHQLNTHGKIELPETEG